MTNIRLTGGLLVRSSESLVGQDGSSQKCVVKMKSLSPAAAGLMDRQLAFYVEKIVLALVSVLAPVLVSGADVLGRALVEMCFLL